MMHSANVLMAAVESGGYISLLKLLPPVLVLLLWAKLLAWADKDSTAAQLPRELLNTVFFIAFIAAFALFILLPNFWIALGALLFLFLASLGTYLGLRNHSVGLADLKKELAELKKGFGKKKSKEAKQGLVVFATKGGAVQQPPEADSPERPGYDAAQLFVTEPLQKNAERVEVRPSEGATAVQFVVDGVSYNAANMEREAGAAGVTYLKKLAGLDVEDRRKPQTGVGKATLDGKRHEIEVSTAGTTAGESMRVVFDPKKRFEHRINTMGMQPEQLEVIKAMVADPQGIVLVCSPKQQGLTTMLYSILRAHDAFLTHIQTVEHNPKEDMEGITQNPLAAGATAAEELKLVQWVTSQEPEVFMADELTNSDSARELIRYAGEKKRAYIGIRAGGAFDALTAWRKLVGNDELAMQSLSKIISGRVMRRLCMACKTAYAPDPDTLRKLNMDPARVTQLYQARSEPLRDSKGNPIACEFCHDLHFKGRFGIYEFLSIDDDIRQAITAGGAGNALRAAFRKQRGRYLQEMALAQVEAGETSIQEVLRVLKGSEQSSTGKAPAARAK